MFERGGVEGSSRPPRPVTPYSPRVHPLTRRIIDRTPDRLRPPVQAAVRTLDAAVADRLPGLAAEIAFWALLSLPSLLLTAIAAASLFIEGQTWQDQLIDRAVEVASVALTDATIDSVVVPVLSQLVEEGGIGLVSFGFVIAVWTASRAVRVVLTTIAIVSGRKNRREGWQDRLLGFAVTLGVLVVGAFLAPLLVAGPNFGDQLVTWLGGDFAVLADVWRVAYWPTVIVVAALALAVLYHLGIPGRSRWSNDWPGAAIATAFWLAGSAGLRIYGAWIADGQSAYGPLAGPIVALLWLWLTGFAVLLGAELNAQIQRVRPSRSERRRNGGSSPTAQRSDDLRDKTDRFDATRRGRVPVGPDSRPDGGPDARSGDPDARGEDPDARSGDPDGVTPRPHPTTSQPAIRNNEPS